MSEACESEYKGKPVFVIKRSPDDKFPFTFGLKKAQMIIEHVDAIRQFVEKHAAP